MSDLLNKLRKNTTIKDSDILADSKFFNAKDMVATTVPAINIALSGKINGGFVPGLTIWAGPSKHFKTSFSLLMAKAYMDKYSDAVMLFYDSEFGTPQAYFDSFGIDTSRVLHTPITDVEQLKFDIMHQFEEIKRGDRVIVVIDSVGNLASKKEVEDALKQNSAADMTRAKQLKSLFRMVTPHLNLKDIPLIVVNHTYQTQEMYSKAVVSGGTGIYYSADNIFIIGRQQEKDGKDITGYNFIINVEKSRFVKEKSKIPIEVSWDKGISKWSGLMDMALESGHVIKPKVGWFQRVDMETGEIGDKNYRMADTYDFSFWHPILQCAKFNEYIEKKYAVAAGSIMQAEDVVEDLVLDEDD
jgi:RecA/RadA recombinase